MTKILLRYDDYSAASNTVLEKRLFEMAAELRLKLNVSIVPFVAGVQWPLRGPIPLLALPPDKIELFKKFSLVLEPVLHGYAHQTVSRFSGLSEFSYALPLNVQVDRLRDGKYFLGTALGASINTFVPPWNAYTSSTLIALQQSGFQLLSGDVSFGPLCPELAFIPSTCQIPEILAALSAAREDSDACITMLFHEYDFFESGSPHAVISIEDFGRLLDRIARQDVKFVCLSDCAVGFDMERAKVNQKLREAMKSPFRKLMKKGTGGVYWSTDVARRKLRFLSFFNRFRP